MDQLSDIKNETLLAIGDSWGFMLADASSFCFRWCDRKLLHVASSSARTHFPKMDFSDVTREC
jgi:hypothetical protein